MARPKKKKSPAKAKARARRGEEEKRKPKKKNPTPQRPRAAKRPEPKKVAKKKPAAKASKKKPVAKPSRGREARVAQGARSAPRHAEKARRSTGQSSRRMREKVGVAAPAKKHGPVPRLTPPKKPVPKKPKPAPKKPLPPSPAALAAARGWETRRRREATEASERARRAELAELFQGASWRSYAGFRGEGQITRRVDGGDSERVLFRLETATVEGLMIYPEAWVSIGVQFKQVDLSLDGERREKRYDRFKGLWTTWTNARRGPFAPLAFERAESIREASESYGYDIVAFVLRVFRGGDHAPKTWKRKKHKGKTGGKGKRRWK